MARARILLESVEQRRPLEGGSRMLSRSEEVQVRVTLLMDTISLRELREACNDGCGEVEIMSVRSASMRDAMVNSMAKQLESARAKIEEQIRMQFLGGSELTPLQEELIRRDAERFAQELMSSGVKPLPPPPMPKDDSYEMRMNLTSMVSNLKAPMPISVVYDDSQRSGVKAKVAPLVPPKPPEPKERPPFARDLDMEEE